MKKKTDVVKIAVEAFVNWSLTGKNGQTLRSSKGFPIFLNPEYPNPEEQILLQLAEKAGGIYEGVLKVRVVLTDKAKRTPKSFDLNDFMNYGPTTEDETLPF